MSKLSGLFRGDYLIWFVFFALCSISAIEVFSAASTLTYRSGNYMMPIVRHISFLVAGIVLVLIVHRLPCRVYRMSMPLAMILSLILLVMVLAGWGVTINDGARWIEIFGIRLQPSEIAKGSMILYIAVVLSWNQTEKGTAPGTFKMIFIPSFIIIVLIAPENASTAAILFAVMTGMMFIGRISLITIGKMLTIVLGILVVAGVSMMSLSEEQAITISKATGLKRVATWRGRLADHFDKEKKIVTPQDFDIDGDAQIGHSKIAIASSNIIGRGPGNSVQRDFIPQAYSDFIYAVIVEEFGLAGTVALVFLYLLLFFRVGYIAKRFSGDGFPAFLAMGLALLLVMQAMANMLVATGIAPVTGQPLPLVSRGGTSTIVNCVYIGMILGVSRQAKKQVRKRKLEKIAEAEALMQEAYEDDYDDEDILDAPPAEITARQIAEGNFDEPDGKE